MPVAIVTARCGTVTRRVVARARLLAVIVLGFGCGDSDAGAEPCDELCTYEATCFSPCDPDEGPECDPEERYAQLYADCSAACAGGQQERAECAPAAERYAVCVRGRGCSGEELDACAEDSRRYIELCVSHPGALVCPTFCAELAVGCTPYTDVGVRGAGCDATCEAAAAELDCVEALYGFDACSAGTAYSCHPLPDGCDDEVSEVQALCEGMAGTTADPDEEAFCDDVAAEQCRCGLWEDPDCATLAPNRCLFELGYGADCRDALEGFGACMQPIASCDRDALREHCMAEWDAYSAACL